MNRMNKVTLKSLLLVSFLCQSNKTWAFSYTEKFPLKTKGVSCLTRNYEERSNNLKNLILYKLEEKKELSQKVTKLLALGNLTNLKTYHLGLVTLNPKHHIPKVADLVQSIRSNENYLGNLKQELKDIEAQALLKEQAKPYLIYEISMQDKQDFYLAHSKGIRHFTVQKREIHHMETAALDNFRGRDYPILTSFIEDTI